MCIYLACLLRASSSSSSSAHEFSSGILVGMRRNPNHSSMDLEEIYHNEGIASRQTSWLGFTRSYLYIDHLLSVKNRSIFLGSEVALLANHVDER